MDKEVNMRTKANLSILISELEITS